MVLEVDLDYPQELDESHNDYPLAAEKICVSPSMLSSYCERVTEIQYKEHYKLKGVNVKLITNEKMLLKYGSKPTVVNTKNLQQQSCSNSQNKRSNHIKNTRIRGHDYSPFVKNT